MNVGFRPELIIMKFNSPIYNKNHTYHRMNDLSSLSEIKSTLWPTLSKTRFEENHAPFNPYLRKQLSVHFGTYA